jgi:hypothetical protein
MLSVKLATSQSHAMSTGTAAQNNHQYTNAKADNNNKQQGISVLFIVFVRI